MASHAGDSLLAETQPQLRIQLVGGPTAILEYSVDRDDALAAKEGGDMSTIDEEMVVAHFIVSDDVERSRRFYTEVLGGKTVISGESSDEVTYVALANSWIIINVGGGPTDDKPTVTLETPPDPDRVSSFLNIRVADIQAVYAEWSARGAQFLTPPKQHETEIRCYIRDPDGYLIEVGQTTLGRGWRPPS
jgi:catechol 2,3-dioxygenase-like lactoylglutathione lyase family enzyme